VTRTLGDLDRRLLETSTAVIGVDEVGRGSLAGPVVVCAASFDVIPVDARVQDSKRISATVREAMVPVLVAAARGWVIVEIWNELVDRLNILEATRLAMRSAVTAVAEAGASVVVDALDLGDLGVPCLNAVSADRDWFCVAAASILAKVHRDRLMSDLSLRYPSWGWSRNKGYGTAEHRLALDRSGRSFLHRRSFAWTPCATMNPAGVVSEGKGLHGRQSRQGPSGS
jgi:ribonuclease HII